MSKCKQEMIAEGAASVPRSCPVHGLQRCPEIKPTQAPQNDGVVAWYDPSNTDPGQSVTFKLEDRNKWPHIYRVPLVPQNTVKVPDIVLELPDGDDRKARIVYSEARDGKVVLSIVVDEPVRPAPRIESVGTLEVRNDGGQAWYPGIPDGVYDVIRRH